jgi:hypothetical protein
MRIFINTTQNITNEGQVSQLSVRRAAVVSTLALCAIATPAAAQLTPLERQHLVAHMEMTGSWLID